jgi:hypothetical protein
VGEIVKTSHEDLERAWYGYKYEVVNFFPSILPLTNEQILVFASHLFETLNELSQDEPMKR